MHSYSLDTNIHKRIIICIFIVSLILTEPVNNFIDFIYNLIMNYSQSLNKSITTFNLFGITLQQITVFGIFAFLYWIFSNYLWKTKFFLYITKVPNLNGKWEGRLISSYLTSSIAMNLEIKQTWDQISFRSIFDESSSYSNTASINLNDNEGTTISFSYRNESNNINLTAKEYIGFNKFTMNEVDTLYGIYFTNRESGTHGKILLKRNLNKKKIDLVKELNNLNKNQDA